MEPDERDGGARAAGPDDPRAPRPARPPDVHDAAGHGRHPLVARLTPAVGRDLVTRISRSPSSSDARDRLLDAAERLLAAEGGGALTTRRIAAEAGVNHGLVHYHFGTVDDLVAELAERFAGRLVALQEALWTVDMSFADRFRAAAGPRRGRGQGVVRAAGAGLEPAGAARPAGLARRPLAEVLTAAFSEAAAGLRAQPGVGRAAGLAGQRLHPGDDGRVAARRRAGARRAAALDRGLAGQPRATPDNVRRVRLIELLSVAGGGGRIERTPLNRVQRDRKGVHRMIPATTTLPARR